MQLLCKEKLADIRQNPIYSVYNKKIISLANEVLCAPIEVISYQEHMFFYREHYRNDKKKLERRRNLSVLAAAYLLTEKEEYLFRAEDYIWAICDEFSWALPAHLKEEGMRNAVPFEEQPQYIELFSTSTAATLAEVDAALGDALSWRIRSRIRMECDRRIFTPFENRLHNLFWERAVHNWASSCSSHIAVAYMHLCGRERTEAILPRLKSAVGYFLDGFDTDGCCLEGFAYWNGGFGDFVLFADLLYRYTDGADDYFLEEKVREIALFGQRMMVGNYRVVNFADGGDRCPLPLANMHLYASHYRDIVLPNKAIYNFDWLAKSSSLSFIEILRSYLWIDTEADGLLGERSYHHYMDKAQWFIEKNAHYSFAAKGGHNAEPYLKSYEDWRERYENRVDRNEPHNHNDIGHFIFYSGDECVFCDLGAGLYYVDYFLREHRYKYLTASSRGHSVPLVDGSEQCCDIYHSARVCSVTENEFSIDISGAYEVDGLVSLVRTFRTDAEGVTLTDTYTTTRNMPITERFVTKIKPIREGNTVLVGKGRLTFPDGVLPCFGEEVFRSHSNEETTAYFIDFSLTVDGEREITFTIR